jgi:NADH-ubiquinone oxidoreductase chain 1
LESELVAGFMTEHGASIFVFFFLGEYSSLILMSAFTSIFFLGGYHFPDLREWILKPVFNISDYFIENIKLTISYLDSSSNKDIDSYNSMLNNDNYDFHVNIGKLLNFNYVESMYDNNHVEFSSKDTIYQFINLFIDKLDGSFVLGFKIIVVVFLFIWVRASFPRLRYDQLMSLCWKELLPLVFAYLIFTICVFYTFDMMPFGINI